MKKRTRTKVKTKAKVATDLEIKGPLFTLETSRDKAGSLHVKRKVKK